MVSTWLAIEIAPEGVPPQNPPARVFLLATHIL
jgi:hypothetical protein